MLNICWVYISQLQTLLYWLNLGYIHFQLQHLNHVIYWIHLLNSKCNSLIFHAYRENLKLNESLCNKLKQLFSIICFSHIWENQGTFSKSKLLFSVTKQLENRYIECWKTLLFNDDNKSGGNKLRTYRKLKHSLIWKTIYVQM